jgi:hypothetical protein
MKYNSNTYLADKEQTLIITEASTLIMQFQNMVCCGYLKVSKRNLLLMFKMSFDVDTFCPFQLGDCLGYFSKIWATFSNLLVTLYIL